MYQNDYMYAIERSDEYLAHYGVRGMRWGVRKAIASGNSARLGKQYAKAQKKLAKLEKRASKADKYKKRAIRYGVGAAAAGGLAAAGTEGVHTALSRGGNAAAKGVGNIGKALTKTGNKHLASVGSAMYKGSRSAGAAMTRAGTATRIWGQGTDIGRAIRNPLIKASVRTNGTASKALNKAQGALRGVSNNTIARIGAGAVGAGLAAASAKNAYRAATAQKKAQQFKSEMNKAFKGTQYANGNSQPRQGGKKRRRR